MKYTCVPSNQTFFFPPRSFGPFLHLTLYMWKNILSPWDPPFLLPPPLSLGPCFVRVEQNVCRRPTILHTNTMHGRHPCPHPADSPCPAPVVPALRPALRGYPLSLPNPSLFMARVAALGAVRVAMGKLDSGRHPRALSAPSNFRGTQGAEWRRRARQKRDMRPKQAGRAPALKLRASSTGVSSSARELCPGRRRRARSWPHPG
jgi:hypothetical protein